MVYPCKECMKDHDTRECGRKGCVDWQRWFLVEWDKFNAYYERSMKEKVQEDGKIPINLSEVQTRICV